MLTCTCDKSSKGRDIKIAEEEDNDDVKTWRAYGDSTRGPVLFVDSNGGKCLRCTGAVSCDSYFKECYENNDHTFFINSTGMADSHPMLELCTSQWSPRQRVSLLFRKGIRQEIIPSSLDPVSKEISSAFCLFWTIIISKQTTRRF